jgi:hypothetical protein
MRSRYCAARYLVTIGVLVGLTHASVGETRKNARAAHPFPEAVGITGKCKGCSCKCGPGFRLPGNNCASWDQHWKFTKEGYPAGTVDEVDLPTTDRNPICPPEAIKEKRALRK